MILFLINPGIPGRNHFQNEYFEKYEGNPKLLTRCDICNILILEKYKCNHCGYYHLTKQPTYESVLDTDELMHEYQDFEADYIVLDMRNAGRNAV